MMRVARITLTALFSLTALASTSEADEPGSDPADPDARQRVFDQLREGDHVRLCLGGEDAEVMVGAWLGASDGSLRLARHDTIETVNADEIDAMWYRVRGTRRARRIGTWAGGVGGLAIGGLYAAYCMSLSDANVPCLLIPAVTTTVGAIVGGVAGAVIGNAGTAWYPALASGSSTPRDLRPGPSRGVLPTPSRGPVGSMSVQVGTGIVGGDADPEIGGAVRLLSNLGKGFWLGPDLGIFPLPDDERLWQLSATLRLTSPRTRPFVFGLVSSGLHSWQSEVLSGRVFTESHLGYGIGVGGGLPLGRRRALIVECRYMDNLQILVSSQDFALVTVTGGLELSW